MKLKQKAQAIRLRKQGNSINEIAEKVRVSKSSVSLWVRDITLSGVAKKRIEARLSKGQIASQKAKYEQTALREQFARQRAQQILIDAAFNHNEIKLLCALIYYCEGTKNVSKGVNFTNSDPGLMALFLGLFRQSYELDERKFRVCVHLHSYHDRDKQLKFWSKTSNIPLAQFIKPYQKLHSGLYKKEGYQGCVSVRYGDVRIARELKAIALECMDKGL
jgi:hypothetical protein